MSETDFMRERRERAEAESFELEKMRHRAQLATPRMRLSTIVPRELTEYGGIPIVPPVRLGPGESVEVWWVLELNGRAVRYEHEGSSIPGARRQFLRLLLDRGIRMVVRQVMTDHGYGVTPRQEASMSAAILGVLKGLGHE